MKSSLDLKSSKFCCVINFIDSKVDSLVINKIHEYLKVNSSEFYMILHNRDYDTNGLLKVPHIHICYFTKRKMLKTELIRLCEFIFGDSKYVPLISIDKWNEYINGIQYLIHKNDTNKTSYGIEEVITSISKDELTTIMNVEADKRLDISYIVSVCDSCKCLSEVYKVLGLNVSRNYRSIINDIFKERKII